MTSTSLPSLTGSAHLPPTMSALTRDPSVSSAPAIFWMSPMSSGSNPRRLRGPATSDAHPLSSRSRSHSGGRDGRTGPNTSSLVFTSSTISHLHVENVLPTSFGRRLHQLSLYLE